MKMINGSLKINNNDNCIGYVSQTAFIINATVRDNILFGLPFNEILYKKCLKVSCLLPDLAILANGDLTEIGARGINISGTKYMVTQYLIQSTYKYIAHILIGGQKQRISFCRCLYRKDLTNIFLLDDPLSAVDIHVGNKMFNVGIKKILNNNTILLVMNSHMHLLKKVDNILLMGYKNDNDKSNATILHQCTYDEMKNLLTTDNNNLNGNQMRIKEALHKLIPKFNQNDSNETDDNKTNSEVDDQKDFEILTSKYGSIGVSTTKTLKFSKAELRKRGKLIKKEDRESGQVLFKTYTQYVNNASKMFNHHLDYKHQPKGQLFGVTMIIIEILLLIAGQASVSGSDIWIAYWSEEEIVQRFPNRGNAFWLNIYTILVVSIAIFTLSYTYLFGYLSQRASKSLHQKMLYCILRAPMLYFNSTPKGQILNRFSKDTNEMDDHLPHHFMVFTMFCLQTIGYIIVIMISMPYSMLLLVILLPFLYWIQKFFRTSSSDLKRLTQTTFTPIISQFNESLQGLDTIRAYKQENDLFMKNINTNTKQWHSVYVTNLLTKRWLVFMMDITSTIFIFFLAIFCALLKSQFENALLSLSVVYGYSLMGMLQ